MASDDRLTRGLYTPGKQAILHIEIGSERLSKARYLGQGTRATLNINIISFCLYKLPSELKFSVWEAFTSLISGAKIYIEKEPMIFYTIGSI